MTYFFYFASIVEKMVSIKCIAKSLIYWMNMI